MIIKTKYSFLISTIIIFLCIISLLTTIYNQQQSYQFINSNNGIKDILLINQILNNKITSNNNNNNNINNNILIYNNIWLWLDNIIQTISYITYNDILSYCYYQENKQNIIINNTNYIIYNPNTQIQSCYKNILYIRNKSVKNNVFLVGNNQILSFGLFMKRSYPKFTIKGSTSKTESKSLYVSSEQSYQRPDARYDPKYIEVCYLNNYSTTFQCVLNDGIKGTPGSTLNWEGEKYNNDLTTFKNTSQSYLYLVGNITTLYPCYITSNNHDNNNGNNLLKISILVNNSNNEPIVTWNENSLEMISNCSNIWVTSGPVIRSKCLNVYNKQFTTRDSFMAAAIGKETVTSLYDLHFYCTNLLNYTIEQSNNIFIQSQDTIRAHITLPNKDILFGNFISSSNEFLFLGEGISLSTLLQFHEFLDKNTRLFTLYIVLRNAGEDELFYSLIAVNFRISSNGYITTTYNSIFIPIVQYYYGLDNYAWLYKNVFISEIFLGFVLLILLLKICYQLYILTKNGLLPIMNEYLNKKDKLSWHDYLNDIWKRIIWNRNYHIYSQYLSSEAIPNSNFISLNTLVSVDSEDKTRINNGNSINMNQTKNGIQLRSFRSNQSNQSLGSLGDLGNNSSNDNNNSNKRISLNSPLTSPTSPLSSIARLFSINLNTILDDDDGNNNNNNDDDENKDDNDNDSGKVDDIETNLNSLISQNSINNTSIKDNLNDNNSDNNMNESKESNNSLNLKNNKISKSLQFRINSGSEISENKKVNKNETFERRRSIIVEFTQKSFRQVKLAVFLTWDLFFNLCSAFILVAMLLYRLLFILYCKEFHEYIVQLQGNDINTSSVVEKIIGDFIYLNVYLNALKIISLVAVLLAISHFFLRTSKGKRLGVVTRTITKTLRDLIPLLFIFLTLLIAFAVLGTEIYGAQLNEWSNLFESMSTLFIMILGNYEIYDAMREVDYIQTAIFFWSYVAIMYFIVVNISLAVIIEVYADIRRKNVTHFRAKKKASLNSTIQDQQNQKLNLYQQNMNSITTTINTIDLSSGSHNNSDDNSDDSNDNSDNDDSDDSDDQKSDYDIKKKIS